MRLCKTQRAKGRSLHLCANSILAHTLELIKLGGEKLNIAAFLTLHSLNKQLQNKEAV